MPSHIDQIFFYLLSFLLSRYVFNNFTFSISSPSLFQRPTTPRHNSTQFEWTIDDVSSLAPANVEVSELQYQQVNDPELEERAQAAINSYFKENEIGMSCLLP